MPSAWVTPMSAATLPSDAADAAEGRLDAVIDAAGLHARRQHAPLRLFRPHPPPLEPPTGVVANISGGVLGGDRLVVTLDAHADALMTGQAAEKIYRSRTATACMNTGLTVHDGAALEWLPQGTILFDRARLDRRMTLCIVPGGRCLAGEILVFGRTGMGEALQRGAIRDSWRVEQEGRPLWIDVLELEGDIAARMGAPFGFAGARCAATAIYAAADAPRWLARARALLGDTLRAGATLVNGVLIARWLSADAYAARAAFARFWTAFRAEALGRPRSLPALWHI